MAHTESFSCHPQDDKDIIDYLNRPGQNKSQVIKAAIRFYMRFGQSLTPEELTNRLEALPELLELTRQLHEAISNGQQFVEGGDSGQSPQVSRRKAIDIMSQMDNL